MTEINAINANAFGFIQFWLSAEDETPFWEQVHKEYGHGGGWKDFEGFKVLSGSLDEPFMIQYPADPICMEMGRIWRDGEMLVMFQHAWVLWWDMVNNTTKIARLD